MPKVLDFFHSRLFHMLGDGYRNSRGCNIASIIYKGIHRHFQGGMTILNITRWWFQFFFIFTLTWGDNPIWKMSGDEYFSNGLKPPPRSGFPISPGHSLKTSPTRIDRVDAFLVFPQNSQTKFRQIRGMFIHSTSSKGSLTHGEILLMAEILHHPGCMKPYK